jgi:uncharacterized protein (TIGR03663 family)
MNDRKDAPRRRWRIAGLAVLIVASALRLYYLDLAPLHHDEGVNGHFLIHLFRDDFYRYNPENYHGPTLYYFALVSVYLFGLTTFAIRAVPAVFGIATVWYVLQLRPWLGRAGSLAAAALVAVSPGALYMSRYFIHETLFVFFTVAIVIAFLRYHDYKRTYHLFLAATLAALLFATKETAIISVTVLLISWLVCRLYIAKRRGWAKPNPRRVSMHLPPAASIDPLDSASALAEATLEKTQVSGGRDSWLSQIASRFGQPRHVAMTWAAALMASILICEFIYSSLLASPRGALDAVSAFKFWARVGRAEHNHPWFEYIVWLWKEDWPALVLGAGGVAVSIWRGSTRFSVFVALWAVGLLVTYSAVPYKTPWLTVNLIIPLAIAGGLGFDWIYARTRLSHRLPIVVLFCLVLSVSGYQSIKLNFFQYDDERRSYVYAHTRREFLDLVKEIERLSGLAGTGRETTIAVSSAEYWPLPWYLRDYKAVGYFGNVSAFDQSIVVGSAAQEPELTAALGDRYKQMGDYPLRPGIKLVLYTRRDIVEKALGD